MRRSVEIARERALQGIAVLGKKNNNNGNNNRA